MSDPMLIKNSQATEWLVDTIKKAEANHADLVKRAVEEGCPEAAKYSEGFECACDWVLRLLQSQGVHGTGRK